MPNAVDKKKKVKTTKPEELITLVPKDTGASAEYPKNFKGTKNP
jgi:hypothetical protein